MTNKEILSRIEKKMLQVNKEAISGLHHLNEKGNKMYHPTDFQIDGDFTCHVIPEDYYINIARYAWGYRGRQIALLYIQGEIDKIKKELGI